MQCLQRFYYYYIIMRSDKTAINYSMSCLNAGLVFRHSDLTVELATAEYSKQCICKGDSKQKKSNKSCIQRRFHLHLGQ